jgi:hypothetical protein
MTKAIVLASALLVAGAAFGVPGEVVLAAQAKGAIATKKVQCERDAALKNYVGKQRSKFIKKCLAGSGRSPSKAFVRRPVFRPLDSTAEPQVTPLGSSRSMGATLPSNAPVAPSAPVTGSAGTSTTGSSATSTSGSSGSSIGSSAGR